MGYYAIGIGGTGAKCLESLVHLAAAGMMLDEDLYVLFVDPDVSNGSLNRAQETLAFYRKCKDILELGRAPLLKTKIVSAEPNPWTPFEAHVAPSLNQFFHYHALHHAQNPTHVAAAHLFEVLYSKQERETSLERGFRGSPSIGSAVMAKAVNLRQNEPWQTFIQQIHHDQNPRVFLAGSIFGGTGAAGFPTIAQLLKNELREYNDVKLGGALVLPYFQFCFPPDDEFFTAELRAKSENFLMNTQAALKYYHLCDDTSIYDAVYLFGDESQTEVDPCLGGRDQRNAPHFIELYAALAAIHFFGANFEADVALQYFMTARSERDRLKWSDLPDGDGGHTIRSQIGKLARFAFAYLSIYEPMLQDIRDKGKGYRAPWFLDFFERNQIQINDNQTQTSLKAVSDYCHAFLFWLANIQTNCGENETIELVNHRAYAEEDAQNGLKLKPVNSFALKDFSTLIQTQIDAKPTMLNKLWERMSDGQGADPNAYGIGKFLSALYHNCAE